MATEQFIIKYTQTIKRKKWIFSKPKQQTNEICISSTNFMHVCGYIKHLLLINIKKPTFLSPNINISNLVLEINNPNREQNSNNKNINYSEVGVQHFINADKTIIFQILDNCGRVNRDMSWELLNSNKHLVYVSELENVMKKVFEKDMKDLSEMLEEQ